MKNARKIVQVGNLNRSNGGTQPYQQDRVYDPRGGLLPALSAELNGLLILIYEDMENCKCFIKQYPHGFNDGFEYADGKAPPSRHRPGGSTIS